MASWQLWFSALLVCCALNQGFPATTGVIHLLTITPEPGQTTPEPCPALPCPAPFPETCSHFKETYFEWNGMLCPGCSFCVSETTTETTTE